MFLCLDSNYCFLVIQKNTAQRSFMCLFSLGLVFVFPLWDTPVCFLDCIYMCILAALNCWQYYCKVGGLVAFHRLVVGGPVLSLAAEHEIETIFKKLLKMHWVFSVAGPTLKQYFVEHELNDQLMFTGIQSYLHAGFYDVVSKSFVHTYKHSSNLRIYVAIIDTYL